MKTKDFFVGLAVFGVVLIVGMLFASGKLSLGKASTLETTVQTETITQVGGAVCGSTISTNAYFNMYNAINEASEENYDQACYLYDAAGSVTAITDTTSPSATVLNCGQKYTLKCVSSDGSAGDSGRILSVRSGNAQVLPNGAGVEFTATGAAMTIDLNSKQHGLLNFRVRDNDADGYLHGTTASENTTSVYTTDAVTFTSKATNGTAIAVGTGETLDLTYDLKSTINDGDFSDFGVYVLIDASTSDYDEPEVTFNGKVLSDIKGSLNVNEARLWSGYEYIYFVDESITDTKVSMNVVLKAISGVNPTTDVEIDFASKGAAKQTLGKDVIISGASDAASPAVIYAVQDTTLDIS